MPIPAAERKVFPSILGYQVILIALTTKLGLFAWAAFRFPFERSGDTPLSIWNRWDAPHYLRIAESGYSSSGISEGRFHLISHFPPLHPCIIAITRFLSGASYLQAGMFVSFFFGILAAYLFARIAWAEFQSPSIVIKSSMLFHLYPVSYFLITPYSESVFFVCVFTSFLLLRQRKHLLLTSTSIACAVATRLLAASLVPVLLVRLFQERNNMSRRFLLVGISLPCLAMLGYIALNKIVWGNPLFFLQHVYEDPSTPRYPVFPLRETVVSLIDLAGRIQKGYVEESFLETLGWGSVLTAFVLSVSLVGAARRLLPWEYSLYSIGYILFYSSFNWGISNARYSFGAFPVFLLLAQLRSRLSMWLLVLLFTPGLLYFSKRFVWGYWAF